MVRIYVSAVIDAPVEKVWGLIPDFKGMPRWHPLVRDSHTENSMPSDAIGSRVTSTSPIIASNCECVYCNLDSLRPVTGYVAGYRGAADHRGQPHLRRLVGRVRGLRRRRAKGGRSGERTAPFAPPFRQSPNT